MNIMEMRDLLGKLKKMNDGKYRIANDYPSNSASTGVTIESYEKLDVGAVITTMEHGKSNPTLDEVDIC